MPGPRRLHHKGITMVVRPFRLALLASLVSPRMAQTALVEEGDAVAGVGNVTSVPNLVINDAGD